MMYAKNSLCALFLATNPSSQLHTNRVYKLDSKPTK